MTATTGGAPHIVADPPLVVPIEDLFPEADAARVEGWARGAIGEYRASLHGSRRHLLDHYDYAHLARKVVGVGSVGMRNWIVLMVGRDAEDLLFLQIKEAEASVLEPFVGRSRYGNMGRRVAEGQWMIQAASDVFLGWVRTTGLDGRQHDYYVRQLWDWKGKADFDTMLPANFGIFAELCGRTLARSHARSGDAIAIVAGNADGHAAQRGAATREQPAGFGRRLAGGGGAAFGKAVAGHRRHAGLGQRAAQRQPRS